MRFFAISLLLVLAGCGSLSGSIAQTDKVLEQRVTQIEEASKRLKSETIAEARDAAAVLVKQASTELKESGKEVIQAAASELNPIVKERMDQADKATQARIDQIDKVMEARINQVSLNLQTVLDKQQEDGAARVKQLMRDEVPSMVEASFIRAADKLAERLGAVKTTTTGLDGVPVEVWAVGGSGLLGWILNFYRVWKNSKTGKKRWSDEELEEAIASAVEQKMRNHNGNSVADSRGTAPPPASGSNGFTWTMGS